MEIPEEEDVDVARAIRLYDVSPIIKQFGTWAVTEYGVECLTTYYPIEAERLDEPDWQRHVGEKPWVVWFDFVRALRFAREHFKKPIEKPRTKQVDRHVVNEPDVGRHRRIRKARSKLGYRVRFLVMKRDKYRCQLCGATASEGVLLEVDHKQPRAEGGSDDILNLWTLCGPCNNGKGTLDL